MCSSRAEADRALERLTALLGDLGLAPKADKTRIVHLTEGGEGFDFLGHADLRVMPTSQGNSLSAAAIGPVRSA
jgi:RNA-directed DNA polymerase